MNPIHSPKTIAVPVSGGLAKQLQENKKMAELEKERRRAVYDAICDLSESSSVDVEVLFEKCSVLDVTSWNEVVEERFLGRVCGLPTCSNGIQIDFKREYVVDRKRKAMFATTSEFAKYCSSKCHGLSRALQSQLDPVPIWSQKERPPRPFSLPDDVVAPTPESVTSEPVSSKPTLVERMAELKIADHLPILTGVATEREGNDEGMGGDETMNLIGWLKHKDGAVEDGAAEDEA